VITAGLLSSVVVAACSDAATYVRTPTDLALQVVSGDSQVGLAYEELPDPIVVRVVSADDSSAVQGQIVNFRVVEGGGSVFAGAAQTNAQGIVQDYWTLGAPGPQRLEARAVSADGEKLVFGSLSATAITPFDSVPAFMQCVDSTGTWQQSWSCGLWPVDLGSAMPVQFRVLNADSLPVPDVLVRFSTWASVPDSINHPGTVDPQQATTDTAGTVTVTWTVDSLTGLYALEAQVERPDGTRLHQTVFVLAYVPTPIPGVVQCRDTTGTWLFGGACAYAPRPVQSTFPITFRVVDADTIPMPSAPVLFHVDTTLSGTGHQDGSVTPDSALTDSLGTITALWTLGQYPGTNRLVATSVLPGAARAVGVTVVGVGNAPDSTIISWTNPAGGS
ncbi:MAG: hypothetical protein V3T20_07975, partial [Gemmatimonadota bacterium]